VNPVLDVSVVIPVYRGEQTLPRLLSELAAVHESAVTPGGRMFHVSEVLLVWDRGPGASDATIRELATTYSWVRPVWLSRNFGQHAATLAGMSSSGGDWIVTMDEDGQHDPAYIGTMLDEAYERRAQLVYAKPSNAPPHGFLRNTASRLAKWVFRTFLSDSDVDTFSSYRLIQGEVGRSASAYTGSGVYLDVALSWVVSSVATCAVPMRTEGRDASNYTTRKLFAHFGRLVISSGTKPLAYVSGIGLVVFAVGFLYAIWVLVRAAAGATAPEGWTSTLVAILVLGGLTLFSLGIIAQYMRAANDMSLGRPLYVVVSDPQSAFDDPQEPPGE
jgi:glycosyltransferase involved in cell wall biosynthesis